MNLYLEIIPEADWKRMDESKNYGRLQKQISDQKVETQTKAQKKRQKILAKKNKRHWKAEENLKYCQFLRENLQICNMTQSQKAIAKVNVKMSQMVKSKTPTQCRSHNQKMLIKYGSYERIVYCLESLEREHSEGQNLEKSELNGYIYDKLVERPSLSSNLQRMEDVIYKEESKQIFIGLVQQKDRIYMNL